jgi:hypothetical protein
MAEQGWIEVAALALAGLQPPHVEKKRATIIALVDARLAGRPEDSVWKTAGVCNRSTYHLKWKQQPDFADALAKVARLAQEWRDTRTLRALQAAAERLALAAPLAVARAEKLLDSDDEGIRLKAAFGILDRAGVETAGKGTLAGDMAVTLRVVYDDDPVSDPSTEAAS